MARRYQSKRSRAQMVDTNNPEMVGQEFADMREGYGYAIDLDTGETLQATPFDKPTPEFAAGIEDAVLNAKSQEPGAPDPATKLPGPIGREPFIPVVTPKAAVPDNIVLGVRKLIDQKKPLAKIRLALQGKYGLRGADLDRVLIQASRDKIETALKSAPAEKVVAAMRAKGLLLSAPADMPANDIIKSFVLNEKPVEYDEADFEPLLPVDGTAEEIYRDLYNLKRDSWDDLVGLGALFSKNLAEKRAEAEFKLNQMIVSELQRRGVVVTRQDLDGTLYYMDPETQRERPLDLGFLDIVAMQGWEIAGSIAGAAAGAALCSPTGPGAAVCATGGRAAGAAAGRALGSAITAGMRWLAGAATAAVGSAAGAGAGRIGDMYLAARSVKEDVDAAEFARQALRAGAVDAVVGTAGGAVVHLGGTVAARMSPTVRQAFNTAAQALPTSAKRKKAIVQGLAEAAQLSPEELADVVGSSLNSVRRRDVAKSVVDEYLLGTRQLNRQADTDTRRAIRDELTLGRRQAREVADKIRKAFPATKKAEGGEIVKATPMAEGMERAIYSAPEQFTETDIRRIVAAMLQATPDTGMSYTGGKLGTRAGNIMDAFGKALQGNAKGGQAVQREVNKYLQELEKLGDEVDVEALAKEVVDVIDAGKRAVKQQYAATIELGDEMVRANTGGYTVPGLEKLITPDELDVVTRDLELLKASDVEKVMPVINRMKRLLNKQAQRVEDTLGNDAVGSLSDLIYLRQELNAALRKFRGKSGSGGAMRVLNNLKDKVDKVIAEAPTGPAWKNEWARVKKDYANMSAALDTKAGKELQNLAKRGTPPEKLIDAFRKASHALDEDSYKGLLDMIRIGARSQGKDGKKFVEQLEHGMIRSLIQSKTMTINGIEAPDPVGLRKALSNVHPQTRLGKDLKEYLDQWAGILESDIRMYRNTGAVQAAGNIAGKTTKGTAYDIAANVQEFRGVDSINFLQRWAARLMWAFAPSANGARYIRQEKAWKYMADIADDPLNYEAAKQLLRGAPPKERRAVSRMFEQMRQDYAQMQMTWRTMMANYLGAQGIKVDANDERLNPPRPRADLYQLENGRLTLEPVEGAKPVAKVARHRIVPARVASDIVGKPITPDNMKKYRAMLQYHGYQAVAFDDGIVVMPDQWDWVRIER